MTVCSSLLQWKKNIKIANFREYRKTLLSLEKQGWGSVTTSFKDGLEVKEPIEREGLNCKKDCNLMF